MTTKLDYKVCFLVTARILVSECELSLRAEAMFTPRHCNFKTTPWHSLGQPGLQSELQDSQGYTEEPCRKRAKAR